MLKSTLILLLALSSVHCLSQGPIPCRDGNREGRCVSPTGCRPYPNTTARPSRQGTCRAGMECCIGDPTCYWAGGTCTSSQACQNGPHGLAFPNHDPLDCQRNGMVCCLIIPSQNNRNQRRY